MTGLSFVTHSEIEGLLGHGASARQQRRRLTKRGLLPEPTWVRRDRQRLGILPEFALAALVAPTRGLKAQHVSLLEAMVKDANGLYGSAAFKRLREAIQACLPELDSTADSAALLDRLTRSSRDALDAWRAEVMTVAEGLSHRGLTIKADPGQIVGVRKDAYILEGLATGFTENHPLSDAPFELMSGAWVVRDRVHTLSSARDFLLPISQPESIGEQATEDADDAMFEEMFAPFKVAPRSVRRLPLVLDDEAAADGPAAPARLARVPLELLEGFTPMTRPRA